MKFHAAVLEKQGGSFAFQDVQVDDPQPDEVVVRMVSTGICGTDAHVREHGFGGNPYPIILGHEGAGIVERVGVAVRSVNAGDRVIMSFPSCGRCAKCLTGHPAYCVRNIPLSFEGKRLDGSNAYHGTHGHFFWQSAFASHALANERNVVKVPDDAPLELLGPLGCGFQTGAGAVMNVLKVPPGASIAVIGTGTVGLAAIMAARVCGAATIIAIDRIDSKLALASELGATHGINSSNVDAKQAILDIVPGGVDFIIDLTGVPALLAMALEATSPSGTAVLIAAAKPDAKAPVDMSTLLNGRVLRGVIQGDSVPQVFLPQLIRLHKEGKFPFEKLVRYYEFDQLERAFEDQKSGAVVKPILRIGKA